MATQVDPPNGVKNQGNHYVLIKPIGRGAYGETNERVAIKKIHNVFENKIDAFLLRHLRHENMVALKDVMMANHKRTFKDVYLQLHRGLKYIHSANFLHRDLKPGNPLVNANYDLKISNKYIESLPYSQPQAISFSRLYPNSHVLALICFRSQKMLVLDPPKRISVTEGLQHPYLAECAKKLNEFMITYDFKT
ncbi:hypothetical protein YC2023_106655 [Brassica napus]